MSPVRARPSSSPSSVNTRLRVGDLRPEAPGPHLERGEPSSDDGQPGIGRGSTLVDPGRRVERPAPSPPGCRSSASRVALERVGRGHGADPSPHGGVGRHPKRSLEEAARRGTVFPAKGSLAGVLQAEHSLAARWTVTSSPEFARAPCGSDAPARGGSRRSPRTRSAGRRRSRSSQSAKRSWRSARSAFGQRLVGGVADEDVAEPERVAARSARTARAGRAPCARARAARGRPPGAASSAAARSTAACSKTRPTTQARSATARSAAASRSSRAARSALIDGGTRTSSRSSPASQVPSASVDSRPSSTSIAEQLLDVQRVALGGRRDPARRAVGGSADAARAAPRSGARVASAPSGSSEDRRRVDLAAAPARPRSSSSGRAGQSSRSGASRLQSAMCSSEVEQGRLGPVDVLDDDDQRPVAREVLEEPPDRPEQLLLRRDVRRQADRDRRRVAASSVGVVASPSSSARILRRAPASASSASSIPAAARTISRDRPVGDALAVRQAAAAQDGRLRRRPRRGTRRRGGSCRRRPVRGG